jgi:galactokinase
LHLPVIACAIHRKMVLSAKKNSAEYFEIVMPDISKERRINIYESFDVLKPNDFFASALRVVKRYGCIPNSGYTVEIKSKIPINAGVSSSSAMVVAWVHFLLEAFGCNKTLTPQLIAQFAYEAEVLEHHGPGGRMDEYTIAIGHIIYIDTSKDSDFTTIGTSLDGMILAESGIPKETIGLLSHVKTNALKSIDLVKKSHPLFDIKTATMDDYKNYTHEIQKELVPYYFAAIKNHLITQNAFKAFKDNPINPVLIGQLMNEHHKVLKDSLKITVPKIDVIIEAALDAGAYGAKIVGSGGGGSIVALAPLEKKDSIIKALLKSGAKSAYEVSVTKGSTRI